MPTESIAIQRRRYGRSGPVTRAAERTAAATPARVTRLSAAANAWPVRRAAACATDSAITPRASSAAAAVPRTPKSQPIVAAPAAASASLAVCRSSGSDENPTMCARLPPSGLSCSSDGRGPEDGGEDDREDDRGARFIRPRGGRPATARTGGDEQDRGGEPDRDRRRQAAQVSLRGERSGQDGRRQRARLARRQRRERDERQPERQDGDAWDSRPRRASRGRARR